MAAVQSAGSSAARSQAAGPVASGSCLNPAAVVIVDDVQHLLVDLLGRHAAAEEAREREVAAVARVGGEHHVLRVELLLGELRHGERAVLLRASAT